MADIIDCSQALAEIEAFRRVQRELNKDITPRLIAWGLKAIAIEQPMLKMTPQWERMNTDERWRQIRMTISADGINALATQIKKSYGPPPKQMSLLDEGTQKNHSE